MNRCRVVLLVVSVGALLAACTSRQADYGWTGAPQAASAGVTMVVRTVSQIGDHWQAIILIRNLTDRDCSFQSPPHQGDPAWLTASCGPREVDVTASLVSVAEPHALQAFNRRVMPIAGPLRVQAHCALIIRVDGDCPVLSQEEAIWTVHLLGTWTGGGSLSLSLSIPAMQSGYPVPEGVPAYG